MSLKNIVTKNLAVLEKLEKFFFALFLLSIPLQTRLTFPTGQTYLNGHFNEYATFFIYLSDIFLIITFFLCFVKTLTKRHNFSIKYNSLSTSPHLIPMVLLSGLLIWSMAGVALTEYKNIALYQTLKLAEFLLLFIYLNKKVLWFGVKKLLSLVFIAGLLQSLIGITQYLNQHSLGLKIFHEPPLAPDLVGVAKIVVDGERVIRAYGTFPHPNVFAGFLILSIFCGFWLLFSSKMSQKNQIVSRETILLIILTIGIVLQFIALILTFSRLAWFGGIIILIIYITLNYKMFHVKHFVINSLGKAQKASLVLILTGFLIIIALFGNQISARTIDTENKYQQSIDYRILYNDIALKTIKSQPLTGVGNGNFTLRMADYSPVPLKWWQYQPVHNTYLLIISELGIIGLILFLIFVFYVLKIAYLKQNNKIVSRETILTTETDAKLFHVKQLPDYQLNKAKNIGGEEISLSKCGTYYNKALVDKITLANYLMFSVFIGFLIMGLFDHYFWTLQQGRLTFWLTIGIILALNKRGN